jgi:hypothetical protein
MKLLAAIFLIITADLLLPEQTNAADNARMTDTERAFLVDQQEQTKKGLLESARAY